MELPFTCKSPATNHMHNHRPPLAVHLTESHPCVHLNSHPVSVNIQHLAAGSGKGYDANLAWGELVDDTTAATLSPCVTDASDTKTFYSALQITDIHPNSTEDGINKVTTTPDMTTASISKEASVTEDKLAKPPKSRSRASSTSQRAPRSASSSTTGTSRKERRRAASYQTHSTATPPRSNSIQMSQQKRDELLALHRDSCRLFQGIGTAAEPLETSHDETGLTQSSTTSPIVSPVLQCKRSHSFPINDGDMSEDDLLSVRRNHRISIVHSEPEPEPEPTRPPPLHQQVPATVIDWTSPSTRRREYEEIDRSNRGFRRVWRRITPRCFRTSETRTPFFETGKDGKGNYEGSVRRFRMDISDEKETSSRDDHTPRPKPVRRTWSCF